MFNLALPREIPNETYARHLHLMLVERRALQIVRQFTKAFKSERGGPENLIPRVAEMSATASQAFRAGVAKLDITPLPGYPLGGHSIAATVSRGVWTRLHATAIYFEDPAGHSLVLVSCDLWSMPAGLADRVAAEMNFQGPASDWPPCNASFSGMVDEFGPRVQSAREQPFISPWAGKTNVLLRVDHRFRGKGG